MAGYLDNDVERVTMHRLDTEAPMINEITQTELVVIALVSIGIGVIVAAACIILLLFANVTFWQLGVIGIISGYYPVGKKLFSYVNEAKKGKPMGYTMHRVELFLSTHLGFRPSFNRHKGAWEVLRK